jgi:hypothetical protein
MVDNHNEGDAMGATCAVRRVARLRSGRSLLAALILLLLPAFDAHAQRTERETKIDVNAADYALILPDTIRAGTHRWTLTNNGNSRHEMLIARLGPNADVHAVIDSLHARGMRALFPGDPQFAVASGALLAVPGKRSEAELVTREHRGDVLLVFCQLRDAPEKPKHDELGMFKVVHVR